MLMLFPLNSETGWTGELWPNCVVLILEKRKKEKTWKLNTGKSCNNFIIIYMIECIRNNFHSRYIGGTKRSLKHRLADHCEYIVNKHIEKAQGHATNPQVKSQGHNLIISQI